MANGRPRDESRRSSRRQDSRLANAGGLEALGKQIGGGSSSVGGSASGSSSAPVANERGLRQLGDRIDAGGGRGRGGGGGFDGLDGGRKKWSRRRKIVTVLSSLLAFVVLVAAAGYGYYKYEFGQIKTAACASCASAANGAPYNVLLIGSDTRTGETAAEAKQFGNSTDAGGQRSDTIKIIHVDPSTGTASTLSIPRDTFVTLSGVPSSSGVSNPNKINSAFASGPNDKNPNGTGANGLVRTIENTFGIPISHWIVINFFGLMDAVNALHGVNLNLPDPIRDYGDCNGNGVLENCTGLDIATTGCQTISGKEVLELSRSRHFEYYVNGRWESDLSSDIGRIERQNLVISAVINKAKSTYNPLAVAGFISSLAHDVTLDNKLSSGILFDLAERYHALSGSSVKAFTLPTLGESYAPYGGEDVEVVQEPQAAQLITHFLGTAPTNVTTPPLDHYGNAEPVSASDLTTTTLAPVTSTSTSKSSNSSTTGSSPAAVPTDAIPSFDPRPC
jgi:LCP family protein required for cell wall assembly